ncbi:MAG: hypothetical protein RSC29_02385, partial [Oscillospiraceae bacterium]
LPLDSDDDNHLAVEVLFKDGRRDTMLINLNNASEFNESTSDVAFSTKDEKYLLDGRIGISSTAFAPVMFGANEFKANDTKIGTNTGEYKGNISDITSVKNGDSENTFITSADLPEGKELS